MITQIQILQLYQGSCFGGAETNGAKVNKQCGVKLGFLENVAIFTSQTKGLKKLLLALKHLPLDSFLTSVKVSETSGSHFPLNS